MSSLRLQIQHPEDWREFALCDCCEVVSRGTAPVYVERSSIFAIGQRCVREAGFDPSAARPHDERFLKGVLVAKSGDVLLNSTGTGTIGRSCVFNETGSYIVDGHITLMRPKPSKVDGRWLNILLKSFAGQKYLENYCYAGSTNQIELSKACLAASIFPIPRIEEQRRIANILDTVDAAIRQTDALVAKLKWMKAGLMQDLLTRGLDARGNLRDPEAHPEQFKNSELGGIPKEWDCKPLSAATLKIADRDHTTPVYVSEGVIMISPINFYGDEGINFPACKRITLTAHRINRKKTDIQPDDVIIHRIGAGLGRVRLVTQAMPEFSILHSLAMIRPDKRFVTASYLLWALTDYRVQMQIQLGTQSIGVPDLGLDKIAKLNLPVPRSLKEQEQIADVLNAHQSRIRAEEANRDKLKAVKQGLMHDLLTGRVRVVAPDQIQP